MVAQKWTPIQDLPSDWEKLVQPDLESLAKIWVDQASKLKRSASLVHFNERLRREWSIETGIIEHLYTIDRGVTQILIEKGLESSFIPHGSTDKPAEEVISILQDHMEVLEGLFDFVASRRQLSTSYIKQLHQTITTHQYYVKAVDSFGRYGESALVRGDWKKLPNNPTRQNGGVHEYCPPEHVAAEMDRLISWHYEHVTESVPPEVESAWLHHRFTQIHPFQDGNGRMARTLASLIFLRNGWFPLVVNRDIRAKYIDSLESADSGDLLPLVALFSQLQKTSLIKALSLSEQIMSGAEPVSQVIEAAHDKLKARKLAQQAERQRVFSFSATLEESALAKFCKAGDEISASLRSIDTNYSASASKARDEDDNSHWFRKQILDCARRLDYFADTRTYRAWVRLCIREERQTDIVFSFHSLGSEFLGILAVSAFIEHRERDETGQSIIDGPFLVCDSLFQFSYNEQEQNLLERFNSWVSRTLLTALDQWRRQL